MEIKDRIKAWVSSSECWCWNKEEKQYCTVCELLIDCSERIQYLESLLASKDRECQVGHNPTIGANVHNENL